jgi:putative Mg2+ transporter-C (MgtC) family protein
MEWLTDYSLLQEAAIKMMIAATLSLIIGVERELKRKPVGLKTSLVIATFSCLLTIISMESVLRATPVEGINVTMDPLRLAAQIVSGIGFLGAGVILHRNNDSITGLTTAAMIWGAAGIGIAVGAGFYIPAIIAVLIVLFGVEVIAPIFFRLGPSHLRRHDVSLTVVISEAAHIEELLQHLKDHDFEVENLHIKDIYVEDVIKHQIALQLLSLPDKDTFTMYRTVQQLHYVETVEIELMS